MAPWGLDSPLTAAAHRGNSLISVENCSNRIWETRFIHLKPKYLSVHNTYRLLRKLAKHRSYPCPRQPGVFRVGQLPLRITCMRLTPPRSREWEPSNSRPGDGRILFNYIYKDIRNYNTTLEILYVHTFALETQINSHGPKTQS
jgi:hypothetical protein